MSRAVTVWTILLDHDGRDAAADWMVLDAGEREWAGRFRFAEHRDRFVARRAAYRRLLAGVVGQEPQALSFVIGPYGKPALAEAGPALGTTHRDRWAMLAVADRPLGIDLEAECPALADPAFVKGILTSDEFTRWQAVPQENQAVAAQAAWTRKEALVKALGTGLNHDVTTLDLWWPQRPPDLWVDPANEHRWSLVELAAPTGYTAALAIADDGQPPEVRLASFGGALQAAGSGA